MAVNNSLQSRSGGKPKFSVASSLNPIRLFAWYANTEKTIGAYQYRICLTASLLRQLPIFGGCFLLYGELAAVVFQRKPMLGLY